MLNGTELPDISHRHVRAILQYLPHHPGPAAVLPPAAVPRHHRQAEVEADDAGDLRDEIHCEALVAVVALAAGCRRVRLQHGIGVTEDGDHALGRRGGAGCSAPPYRPTRPLPRQVAGSRAPHSLLL